MTRRPGLSLTEVLVALFIMALGTISILTMFPLGALQMGQALKDDRTSQAAAAADAYMRWYWKERVVEGGGSGEPFVTTMFTPPNGMNMPPATGDAPSYPVLIDPMGSYARGAPNPSWVGDGGFGNVAASSQTGLARASLLLIGSPPHALRTCSLLDGFTYDPNSGLPAASGGAGIDREMRYNWLWVVQCPKASDPRTANMSVVVFDKRAHMYAPTGSETVFTPNYAVGNANDTRVSFPANAYPKVQKGGWLLDATVTTLDSTRNTVFVPPDGAAGSLGGIRNAHFYRVVSVTENPVTVSVDIELQKPLTDSGDPGNNVPLSPMYRRFVVMPGLAEVFERPPLTK